jgi:hypothetical protein
MNAVSWCMTVAVIASLNLLIGGQPAAAQQPTLPSRPANSTNNPIAGYVEEASQRFGIPAPWIRAVMQVESAGEIGVTSSAGAMGLMQVMPQTYATLRARLGLGANAYDPHDNIIAGAAYLREMHDRYGDAGFLAAYNAGPARYEEFRAGGRSLPSETILYMARLGPMLGVDGGEPLALNSPIVTVKPEEAPIFVSLRGDRSAADVRSNASPPVRFASVGLPAGQQSDALFTARQTAPSSTSPAVQAVAPTTVGAPPSTPRGAVSVQPGAEPDDIFVHRGAARRGP